LLRNVAFYGNWRPCCVSDFCYSQGVSPRRPTNADSIFRQENSWDRLKTSEDIVRGLLSRLDVFLPFLDHIHSFGYKSNDIGDDYHNFSSTMGKQSKTNETNDGYGRVPTLQRRHLLTVISQRLASTSVIRPKTDARRETLGQFARLQCTINLIFSSDDMYG
jgi:hypothetical protein